MTKQFTKHSDVRVIDQAVQTIATLTAAKTLGQTNTTKLVELEDTLVSALRECVEGKDVESAAFDEDELLALTSAVLRIGRLYAAHDLSKAVHDAEDGKTRAWDIVDSLVERGRLGYKDEIAVRLLLLPLLPKRRPENFWKTVRSLNTRSGSLVRTSSGASAGSSRRPRPTLTPSCSPTLSIAGMRSLTTLRS